MAINSSDVDESFYCVARGGEIDTEKSLAEAAGFGDDRESLTSSTTSQNGYVELGNSADKGDKASVTLRQCKKYVMGPYNILLTVDDAVCVGIIIGWRRFQSKKDETPCYVKCLNIIYPVFIFLMLVLACVAQVSTCFHRTRSVPPTNVSDNYSVISCYDHQFTYNGISYILTLLAYVLAFYTFRVSEPEHLSSMTERVFLSFNEVVVSKSRKKPLITLLIILVCGVVFFLASAIISVARLYALKLYSPHTIIGWFSRNITAEDQQEVLKLPWHNYIALHYSLIVFALFGFLFFDLLYIAVTISYCSQCQLLKYYIENIQDKVRNKKYENLSFASKEIYRIYESLKILNGNISIVATLVFFIFVSNLFLSYKDLIKPYHGEWTVAAGFLNATQWLAAAVFPVVLAMRLTTSGNELRRLGLEIASRPFYYSSTPDLELQFFLTFTESTRYQVNLGFIPMQPSLVLGFGFVVLLFLSSGVILSQVESVKWF